jgi:hypothetical protein
MAELVAIAVKLSVSLPEDDVAFLDAYGQANGNQTRSAVLHLAIFVLRGVHLASSYEEAWSEWAQTAEAAEWAAVPGARGAGANGAAGSGPDSGSGAGRAQG